MYLFTHKLKIKFDKWRESFQDWKQVTIMSQDFFMRDSVDISVPPDLLVDEGNWNSEKISYTGLGKVTSVSDNLKYVCSC